MELQINPHELILIGENSFLRLSKDNGQSAATRNLEVLTLEQAVALALRDNPQIKNASLEVNKSVEEFAATRTRRSRPGQPRA